MTDNQELSQAEIWDDTALVESWDEAFTEYQKYHSLAAKGERVALSDLKAEEHIRPKVEAQDPLATAANDDTHTNNQTGGQNSQASAARSVRPPPGTAKVGASLPAMPAVALANMEDEDMKNLMMSWYYAGYYTGLFEGKQQAYASLQSVDG